MNSDGVTITKHRGRVLIVEDGSRFRQMLTRAIGGMGFDPRPVDCAEAAIPALEDEITEIALVDLGLPGMSGLELCRYLRKHFPSVQIVILTGFGDLEAAKQAIRLDVVDFLTKPCDHRELRTALERALERHADAARHPDGEAGTPPGTGGKTAGDLSEKRAQTIEQIERRHILDAIERNNGNRSKAAKELGISVRTLYYRLSRYKTLGQLDPENPAS